MHRERSRASQNGRDRWSDTRRRAWPTQHARIRSRRRQSPTEHLPTCGVRRSAVGFGWGSLGAPAARRRMPRASAATARDGRGVGWAWHAPCRAGYCAARDTVPCGIPCRVGYRAARDTVPRGIPCRAGYRAARDTVPCGIPCRAGYRAVRDMMPSRSPADSLGLAGPAPPAFRPGASFAAASRDTAACAGGFAGLASCVERPCPSSSALRSALSSRSNSFLRAIFCFWS